MMSIKKSFLVFSMTSNALFWSALMLVLKLNNITDSTEENWLDSAQKNKIIIETYSNAAQT